MSTLLYIIYQQFSIIWKIKKIYDKFICKKHYLETKYQEFVHFFVEYWVLASFTNKNKNNWRLRGVIAEVKSCQKGVIAKEV